MANHISLSNRVQYLRSLKFTQLTLVEKIAIKDLGRPVPNVFIKQTTNSRGKVYERKFNPEMYNNIENHWLCGCEETNRLYCFPCLLFSTANSPWVTEGVNDLSHLTMKMNKHKVSQDHLNSVINLKLLGKVNIHSFMDSAFKQSIVNHNDQVRKNRDMLSKIINIIKFCDRFELLFR